MNNNDNNFEVKKMVKQQEISLEEKTEDIVAIETQRKTLSDQVADLLSVIIKTGKEIQQAEQKKSQAKTNYNNCLDSGSESGMSNALSVIREADGRKRKLTESLSDLSKKIEPISEAYKKLMSAARNIRADTEKKLQEVQNQFKETKLFYDRCNNILGNINDLTNELQKIEEQISPKEASVKTDDIKIEGNV